MRCKVTVRRGSDHKHQNLGRKEGTGIHARMRKDRIDVWNYKEFPDHLTSRTILALNVSSFVCYVLNKEMLFGGKKPCFCSCFEYS